MSARFLRTVLIRACADGGKTGKVYIMKVFSRVLAVGTAGLMAGASFSAVAAEDRLAGAPGMESITVYARGERQIGIADAASAGAVGEADLTTLPVLSVARLLEVIPGLIAAQHSGSGKANQYFLRGISLDHGTDFAGYFDDVPLNFRTHGHGQGYLDLNGVIPETIERIDYRKGPYRADIGDFALAGASFMESVSQYDTPFVTAEYGSYDYKRLVLGGSTEAVAGLVTGVLQLKTYDGPWQQAERLRHASTYTKYTRETSVGRLDIGISGYYGQWRPTEQIPERALGQVFSEPGAPTISWADAYCAIDPTARGETGRVIASARLTGDDWRSTFYVQYYDWHMSSNPTFYLDDPVNGDQILQVDRRWTLGGRLERDFQLSSTVALKAGSEARYDDIQRVGVNHTVANVFFSPISLNAAREGSLSPYAEAQWIPVEGLRLLAGLRGDVYRFDVSSLDTTSITGSKTASMASPKASIAYRPLESVELYANWGRGLHSNDARGVVNTATPVPGLVKGTAKEGGVRLQEGSFTLTATYWWLNTDSELKFVGDSNSVEPSDPAWRRGYELTLFWRPFAWLAVNGAWTGTRARFTNGDFIPGALENVGEVGFSSIFDKYEFSMRTRYVGAYPLIEDNSARAKREAEFNFRAAWKPTARYMFYVELLNALDHEGKDIQYLYTSRLPGEPAEGVDGVLSRLEEPRTVRAGLKVNF